MKWQRRSSGRHNQSRISRNGNDAVHRMVPAFFCCAKGDGMKVAFTSSSGTAVDEHFGQCQRFHIWEIGPEHAEQLATVSTAGTGEDEEDRIAARADAIADCAIVYTVQIGGPAAAKLVARKIHPMKTNTEVPVQEVVAKLQEVLRGNPPPWLRKAMNKENATSFDED
jgi:nitrogen fixation protein NifX